MQLTGEQIIPAAIPQVWGALNDMALIRRCIPGCESIEPLGDGRHAVAVVAAVGLVKARFRGTIALRDVTAPTGYTLAFEGSGGVAGFARGEARVQLEAAGDGQTRLRHEARADIGGRLAQVGSRLVDAAAAKLSAEFFDALRREIAGTGPAGSEAPPPGASGQGPGAAAPPSSAPVPATPGQPLHVVIHLQGGGWLVAAALAGALLVTLLRG